MVTSKGDTWIVDSGADRHITGDISKLSNIRPCSNKDAVKIEWGDGHAFEAEAVGDVMLHGVKDADLPIKLRNVLYIPTAKHNLFSLQEAARAGAQWGYDGKAFKIMQDGELVATACELDGGSYGLCQALWPSQL